MKLGGHPIHPLLIHFPTALLPMDLFFSWLSYQSNDPSFMIAGFYCLAGGVLLGLAAIVTGVIEMFYIPRSEKAVIATGFYHGFINGSVIAVFAVLAYKGWLGLSSPEVASLRLVSLKAALTAILFIGNYFGGQLIYKYFVGIPQKMNQDGSDQV